jgi:hypothetical protein
MCATCPADLTLFDLTILVSTSYEAPIMQFSAVFLVPNILSSNIITHSRSVAFL